MRTRNRAIKMRKREAAIDPSRESATASSLEALLSVTLDDNKELAKEYASVFYPSRAGKNNTTQQAHYYQLVKYITHISASLNIVSAQCRYLVREAPAFETMADTKYRQGLIERNLRELKASVTEDTINVGLKAILGSLNVGKAHIIKPSVRFKGGYDVIYSGLPTYAGSKGTAVSISTPLMEGQSISESPTGYMHKEMSGPGGAYTLKLGTSALSRASMMLAQLFGDMQIVDMDKMHERRMSILPLQFDFNRMFTELANDSDLKAMGITLGDHTVPAIDPAIVKGLGKYFSILAIREANHSIVRKKLLDNGSTPNTVSAEALMLKPEIGLSIVMHLPMEICEFITQTTRGEAIPLTALNTWASMWSAALLRIPNQRVQKGGSGKLTAKNIPRYVIPASGTPKLLARRKDLGFYGEEGRTNEDDMYVSNKGTFNYCPKSADLSLDNAKVYERLMEEALQLSFDAGTPLNASQIGETNPVFGLASPAYKEKISVLKQQIKKFGGALQTYSWDYNCILTSGLSDPDKLVSVGLSGTARPDELAIADYLRKPFAKSMSLLFTDATMSSKKVGIEAFGHGGAITPILKTSPFVNTFKLYEYLLSEGLMPSVAELVKEAAADMGMSKLTDEAFEPYEKNLYTGWITTDLEVAPQFSDKNAASSLAPMAIVNMFGASLRDGSGYPGSNLARQVVREGVNIEEDPHYFNPEHFTLAEFKNVYSYLGGRVFYTMLKHLRGVDKKNLMIVNPTSKVDQPNYQSIVNEVMPLVVVLSKYVPDSEAIYAKADVLSESNQKDTSIGPDDIHVPGSKAPKDGKAGLQMFPHQVGAHQYLRNSPRFAVLDVAPGGGKTILLLTDVAALVREKKVSKALIIAPNGLVKNWVEDMHLVTEGKWNVIPITTASYNTWGDERLTKMISTAPRNTIVVVGSSVLRLRPYPVVIGNHVEKVSGTLEFIKKFGFDYVALDESHRAKNSRTVLHKAIKQLTTCSAVKYVRLATGTLISNKLTDVVGQAALFNSQIFRTAEEYEAENSETVGDTRVTRWKKDTPKRAREQLSKHVAVISTKRKEWAFMLPVPVETFIPVPMMKDEADGGSVHQLMYDAILKETLDEIKADKDIVDLLSGKDTEGGADDEDEDDGEDGAGGEDDLDDATMVELESKLEPYLARLEQLLTDPVGDPFGELYFKGLDRSSFVSNKVLKIIERIKLSFIDYAWEKGKSYKTKAVVDIDGQRYVLMPPEGVSIVDNREAYYADYKAVKDPTTDPRWKKEPRGKVIVFCRYKRSVNAIYRALPPELQKIAVKFHGDVKDKHAALDAFKANPLDRKKGAQILIANEQSISEGHNLQMADRMIRVESPWAPGELDQSASRIFRPDPSGKFSRENIYLDWVITNGSLEVAKMGRLISKMLIKAQFDESDNPLYANINEEQLPLIRMSLETIESVPLISDISNYIEAYQDLASIQGAEFKEMRATRPSKMFDIEPEPMFDDAKLIEYTPYIPNLRVPDRHNFGLVKLTDFMQDVDNPEVLEIQKDKNKLVGMYAHTEMGNGTIVRVNLSKSVKGAPESMRGLSRVHVKLAGSDEIYEGAPSMIHLATNLDENTIKNFALATPWATKGDKAKAERLRLRAERKADREAARMEKSREKELLNLEKLRKLEKLKTGAKKPKAREVEEELDEEEEEEVEEENNNLELYPVVYNEFLALEAVVEDDDIDLKEYGFRKFGDYAYVAIKDYASFTAVLAFLDSKYMLASVTRKRLDVLHNAFASGRGRKFDVAQAPMSELKNFYALRHTTSKLDKTSKKPELKVYPVLLNGVLMLNVDIGTNPAVRKIMGKVIPGTKNIKFTEASGIDIQFFPTKNDLIRKVKALETEGFIVTNKDELKKEVAALTLKKSK